MSEAANAGRVTHRETKSPVSTAEDKGPMSLIAKARAGDMDAMGQLVENYRKYLLLIANKNIDSDLRAKVGASDVVQQSMLNAQQHFDQFHGNDESELKAWLNRILQNDLHKTRRTFKTRKRSAQQEINLQEHSAIGRALVDACPTPSSRAIQQEKARMLANAMDTLSEDHQQVIRLRNFEQLGFEEIGAKLNRSTEAARKLWSRAIQVLQTTLSGRSDEFLTGVHAPIKPTSNE